MRTAVGRTAAVVLAAALVGGSGHGRAQYVPAPARQADVPERVDYRWRIRPLGGEPVELDAYRGRVLFINAWASWCIPCIREMAGLERLAARLSDTDVAFLLVAVEGEGPVRRHLRLHPIALPVFVEEQRFPRAFGLRGIPMSWIVDRGGHIAFRFFGAADWDAPEVEAFLREIAGESERGAAIPP